MVWLNGKELMREFTCAMADKIDDIVVKSKFNLWKNCMTLALFKRNKGKRISSRIVLRKIFNGFRANTASCRAAKKAMAKFAHRMLDLERSVFVKWSQHVKFVRKKRKRLQMLRLAESRAEAIGRRKDKVLLNLVFTEWGKRVRRWLEKRDAIGRGDSHFELYMMKLGVGNWRDHLVKQRAVEKAALYWHELEDRRAITVLSELSRVASEGRRKVAFIHLRYVLRHWRDNVVERKCVRRKVVNFRGKKENELCVKIMRRWHGVVGIMKGSLGQLFAVTKRGWLRLAFRRWTRCPMLFAGAAMVRVVRGVDERFSLKTGFMALERTARWTRSIHLVSGVRDRGAVRTVFEVWLRKVEEAAMWEERARAWIRRLRKQVLKREAEDEVYVLGRVKKSFFSVWIKRTKRLRREEVEKETRIAVVNEHLASKAEARAEVALRVWIGVTQRGTKRRWELGVGDAHFRARAVGAGFEWWLASARARRRAREGREKARRWGGERILRKVWRAWRGEWRAGKESEGGGGEDGGRLVSERKEGGVVDWGRVQDVWGGEVEEEGEETSK